MDLHLVMNELRPGENVAPDLSTWEAMNAKWRGSGSCPSKAACQAKWDEIKTAAQNKQIIQTRFSEYAKRGANIQKMLLAIYEKLANNSNVELAEVKAIIDQVNSENPKS